MIREILIDDALPIGAVPRSSSRNAIDWLTDPAFPAASGRRVIRQAFAGSYHDQVEFKLRPIVFPHDGVFEFALRVEAADIPNSVGFGVLNGKEIRWNKSDTGLVRDGAKESEIVPGQ